MNHALIDPWFEAEFVGQAKPDGAFRRLGSSIEGAQGILLYSPCGYGKDDGTHAVLVWFSNPRNAPTVPAACEPKARWAMTGSGLHDLTLSPSIDCTTNPGDPKHNLKPGECRPGRRCWHGFIRSGRVT